jgi:pimeloyl-ACP methyl ester carboxylesterase
MKIVQAGYDFEEHKIVTEDKYILTSWRIPGGVNEKASERKKRKPIILQHGLFDSSYSWLLLNATDCLPIQLALNGFDVWITNSRGNLFSSNHLDPEYDSDLIYSKFWDFTFHEMAVYDFPASILYIKNVTGFEKINYIGHSQGTIQYFIYYTLNAQFIESSIDKFVAVGTVVNVFNTVFHI